MIVGLSQPGRVRSVRAGWVFVAAGIAWSILGTETIVNQGVENYRNSAMLLPWLLTAAAATLLHRLQAVPGDRRERWAFRTLIAGLLVGAIGQPGLIAGVEALEPLAFVGFLGFLAGTFAFGLATWRRGTIGRMGLALALTQVGTMAMGLALSPWVPLENEGSYSGAIVHGAVFTAVGFTLLRCPSLPARAFLPVPATP